MWPAPSLAPMTAEARRPQPSALTCSHPTPTPIPTHDTDLLCRYFQRPLRAVITPLGSTHAQGEHVHVSDLTVYDFYTVCQAITEAEFRRLAGCALSL